MNTDIPTKHRILFQIGDRVYEISEELACQWIENGNARQRQMITVRKGSTITVDGKWPELITEDCRITFYRE